MLSLSLHIHCCYDYTCVATVLLRVATVVTCVVVMVTNMLLPWLHMFMLPKTAYDRYLVVEFSAAVNDKGV